MVPGGPLINEAASSTVSVTPTSGALALTGYAPTAAVTNKVNVVPSSGALALAGHAPTVATPRNVTPIAGTLVLTGYVPDVSNGSHPDWITTARRRARR